MAELEANGKNLALFVFYTNANIPNMKRITNSKIQTQKLAKNFVHRIVGHRKSNNSNAVVIGLSGELGSGKTTFVQGFAKSSGIKKRVISPTFVLMKRYKNLYHIDCYRINNPKEITDLRWKDLVKNPENIILVEWAEKIKKIFPKPHFWVKFSHIDKNKRSIDIQFVK